MGRVYAGADQGDSSGATAVPVGFGIGTVVDVDIHLMRDLVLLCQGAQLVGEVVVVGAAGVFHADGGMIFVRGLAFADGGHIHRHKFFDGVGHV